MLVCRAPRSPHVTRLAEALLARDVPVAPLRAQDLWRCLDRGDPPPLVALLRLPSGTPRRELDILRALQPCIPEWIDAPGTVARVHDKPTCLADLAAAGVPVPPSLAFRRGDVVTLDDLPGDRFVVKPVTGAAGHGVTLGLARDVATAAAAAYADLCGGALVQTEQDGTVDRRLWLLDGALVAGMERRPARPGERASSSYGATAAPWSPSRADLQLALRASKAVGLTIAAVDLVEHAGRHVVLEVNSSPGLAAIEAATGRDVAGALAEHVVQRLAARR